MHPTVMRLLGRTAPSLPRTLEGMIVGNAVARAAAAQLRRIKSRREREVFMQCYIVHQSSSSWASGQGNGNRAATGPLARERPGQWNYLGRSPDSRHPASRG